MEGNVGFYVHDGHNQLAWMLAAIGQATTRIDFEIYTFEPDAAGASILNALAQAAKRGVVVRLLYDAVGSANVGAGFFQPLLDAGGLVLEFNPIKPWRLRFHRFRATQSWEPNHRDHRKLMVCDCPAGWAKAPGMSEREQSPPICDPSGERSALVVTGGRNVADQYLSMPLGQGQWRDGGIVLIGPAAVRLGDMFESMWKRTCDESSAAERPVPELSSPNVGELVVLPLESQPGFVNLIQWSLSRLTFMAKRELRISCAYFIPSVRFRRTLVSAARRFVRCTVLIPLHNDVPIVGAASRHSLGTLLEEGVSIYQYATQTLHEKTYVFDRWITVIGSSNIDQRSFRLNYELVLVVLGESFAAPVVKWHDADLLESQPYTLAQWRTRPWLDRFTDWFWWLFRSQL